jgi:hypothetical protein
MARRSRAETPGGVAGLSEAERAEAERRDYERIIAAPAAGG